MARIKSKNALPQYGRIEIDILFQVIEKPGRKFNSQGESRYYKNVLYHRNRMLDDAIKRAIIKRLGNGTWTPYNIKIIYYTYVYYINNYKLVEKNGKIYERYRDKNKNRTRYYVVNDKKILPPDIRYKGIYK